MVVRFNRRWFAAAALSLAGAGTPQPLVPTPEEVAAFSSGPLETGMYTDAAVMDWKRRLQTELASKSLGAAATALANQYRVSPKVMERLVGAFIVTSQRRFGRETSWKMPVQAELRELIPEVRSTPFGLVAIAGSLDAIEECRPADFAALIAEAPDKAFQAYRIALAAPCTGNFLRAIDSAGNRSMPAILELISWGPLPRSTTLATYQWMVEPAQLQRIAPADRSTVAAHLRREYLGTLLDAGLDQLAIQFYDRLSEPDRTSLLSSSLHARVTIDGIAVGMNDGSEPTGVGEEQMTDIVQGLEAAADALEAEVDSVAQPQPSTAPKLTQKEAAIAQEAAALAKRTTLLNHAQVAVKLAAAMLDNGREADARRLLSAVPQIKVQRQVLRCTYDAGDRDRGRCGAFRMPSAVGLMLDQSLNHGDEDPYWLAETLYTSGHNEFRVSDSKLAMKLFPRTQYPEVWLHAEKSVDHALNIDEEEGLGSVATSTSDPVFERAVDGFAARREALSAAASAARVRAGIVPEKRAVRASVTAVPPDFVEAQIPAAFRGRNGVAAPKGLAPLPEGYLPIRIERDGPRAIAVSVSQTFDPTGEASQGGYWVHLSEDGGKSWAQPLYTGLADRFPYVVLPSSPMKLLAGDDIHLAVEVAEIDTSSISYPPIALRTRRRASDRYLTIPISRLRADRDGDGLTDIAEHHLLLDRPAAPFVVGSDAATCTPGSSPTGAAQVILLDKLYRESGTAIVEPLDRPGIEMAGWKGAASVKSAPIFLQADAADYRCLRTGRPIIIYSAVDRTELEKMTPDFHMLTLPPIQFNRAGDRGYVRWSGGWHGGTYRLRRVNGAWAFDSISSWIS